MKKAYQDIKISEKETVRIIFEADDKSVSALKKAISVNIKRIRAFYKISIPKIYIELIYSRKEFNNKLKRLTEAWEIGFAVKTKWIFIFSPSVVEKFSNHKKGDIYKTAIHEICHTFNNKINKESLKWINEGLCLILANQTKKKLDKNSFYFFVNNFLLKNPKDSKTFAKNHGYQISYRLVKIVLKKFGKQKTIDLLKINPERDNVKLKLDKILGTSIKIFAKKVSESL